MARFLRKKSLASAHRPVTKRRLMHVGFMKALLNVNHNRFARNLTLFYPTPSLIWQLHFLFDRRVGKQPRIVFDHTFPGMRRNLYEVGGVLIDATEDPSAACEAYFQAVHLLDASAVAVYSERTLENLEILVRSNGSPYFVGPMEEGEWEAFFAERRGEAVIPFAARTGGCAAVHSVENPFPLAENAEESEPALIPFAVNVLQTSSREDDRLSAMLAETIALRRDMRTLTG